MPEEPETSTGVLNSLKDLIRPDKFNALREKKSNDVLTQQFFGMKEAEIAAVLDTVEITGKGFDVSPGFQSPGYGDAVDHPLVKLPDLIPAGEDQIDHEFNHSLHYGICKRLFENDQTIGQAIQLIRDEILADTNFIEHTMKNGSPGQKMLIASVESLLKLGNPPHELIKAFSWQLGALHTSMRGLSIRE